MDIWQKIAEQRLQLADLLEGFNDVQWRTPSLCAGWTVRDVVGHLITPFVFSTVRMVLHIVRHRLDFDKAMDHTARQQAQRPTSELVALLRTHAPSRWTPPGLGPDAPLTDIVMHIQDICRPLGIQQPITGDTAGAVLDFLVSRKGRVVTKPAWLTGLRLLPDDIGWTWGEGVDVRGPAAALIMALGGREVGLEELTGAGVGLLRTRIAS